MLNIIAIAIAYVLGSIPCAVLLSKFLKFPDPRTQGSGNPGATNILRIAGKKEALIVLGADALKGLIAVWIGMMFGVTGFWLGLVALGAVAGHVFPVFSGFKGGKGVATAIGSTLGLSFFIGILLAVVWVTIAFITRYASLASLIAVCISPILMLVFGDTTYAFPALLIAALVVWKHKDNIQKLRTGTEDTLKF